MAFTQNIQLELNAGLGNTQRLVIVRDASVVVFGRLQSVLDPYSVQRAKITQAEQNGMVSIAALIRLGHNTPPVLGGVCRVQCIRGEPSNFFPKLKNLIEKLPIAWIEDISLSESNGYMTFIFSYWESDDHAHTS